MDSFVQEHLKKAGLESLIEKFKEEEIDEATFLNLRPTSIESLFEGLKIGPKQKLIDYLEKLHSPPKGAETETVLKPSNAEPPVVLDTSQQAESVIESKSSKSVAKLVEQFTNASKPPTPTGARPEKSINILLLGETGVGKSTWINGFINYLKFATFEEAVAAPNLLIPIPTAFSIMDPEIREMREVRAGDPDDNEITGQGLSSTQEPRSYKFTTSDERSICLIDTPGIGDVRGPQQDRQNMDLIMLHLSTISELHGICILLKPDVTKISVQFQFCLKELLARLHKSATRNVIFCFTNTRSTFYEPGNTLPNLRLLLSPHSTLSTEIPVTEDTYFCVDNEAVRFLVATRCGIKFRANMVADFANSWSRSVLEMNRMIQHILTLTPHAVEETRELNVARDIICHLAGPLAQFAANIQQNVDAMEVQLELAAKLELSAPATKEKAAELEAMLHMPITEINLEEVDPTTICTSTTCSEMVMVKGKAKVNYKKRCHAPCGCKSVHVDTAGAAGLWRCSAFSLSFSHGLFKPGYYCRHCKCSWLTHMRVEYECRPMKSYALNEEIMEKLNGVTDEIERKKLVDEAVETLQAKIAEAMEERHRMLQISSKFAHFLRQYAIGLYNDAMRDYLNMSIQLEEQQVKESKEDGRKLRGLREMLAAYEEEAKILEDASQAAAIDGSNKHFVRAKDIQEVIEEAYKLNRYGKQFKEYIETRNRRNMRYKSDAKARESTLRKWILKQDGLGVGNALQEWMKQMWEPKQRLMAKARPDLREAELTATGSGGSAAVDERKLTPREKIKKHKTGVKVMDFLAGVSSDNTSKK